MSTSDSANCTQKVAYLRELSTKLSESKAPQCKIRENKDNDPAKEIQNSGRVARLTREHGRIHSQERKSTSKKMVVADDFYLEESVSNLKKRFEESANGSNKAHMQSQVSKKERTSKASGVKLSVVSPGSWIGRHNGREDTAEDDDVFDNEKTMRVDVAPKSEMIIQECLSYINQVHRCLTDLLDLKEELDKEFAKDTEILKSLSNVFRDIQTLKSAYKIILDTIDRFQSKSPGSFYLYDVLLDPVVCSLMKMYKPFLNNYAVNTKWMGAFFREHQKRIDTCNRSKDNGDGVDGVSMDQCLYTVFNSLFSLELMFDRYRRCFDEKSVQFRKAEEAKNIISNLLSTMNSSQDQENFLRTQKELTLLTGRKREPRINTYFIHKGVATIYSKRDDKPLSRQLVLFSDCLYVTLLPSNNNGPSSVRQELTTTPMDISEVQKDDSTNTSFLEWGLILDTKWAVQRLYFENENVMKTWKEKLAFAIGESTNTGSQINVAGKSQIKKK